MNIIDFLVKKMALSPMREKIVRNLFWSSHLWEVSSWVLSLPGIWDQNNMA